MTVSMAPVASAGGAASYFSQDNYYTVAEAEAVSEWAGVGAADLGLKGAVERETFEALLKGELPGGKQVGSANRHDHGRDFTFSAPKSVSLLGLVTGDKRLVEANMKAAAITMAWAEKNLAEARLKIEGKAVPVRTGNLVYALFPHDTSRALDPQLHVHAVVANMTRLPEHLRGPDRVDAKGNVIKDDGWRAWHNGQFYRNNTVLGAIYHAALRAEVEKLGYRTEVTGKHGMFEIADVNREAIAGFSKRANDIEAKASELGITSNKGRDRVTVATRDDKVKVEDRAQLVADWREEAKDYAYNGDTVYREALERSAEPVTGLARTRQLVASTIAQASAALREYLRRPSDPLVDQGLSRLVLTPAAIRTQFAVASAVRIQAEKEAAFNTRDLAKTALDPELSGVTIQSAENRIDQLVERGDLVREKSTRIDGAADKVTTREAIQTELAILCGVDKGRRGARPLVPAERAPELLQQLSPRGPLGQGQLAAAVAIVSSRDRIVVIQGRAGSGKSTMLQPVARAEMLDATGQLLSALGKDALLLTADQRGNAEALAFQNKMVADLKRDTGMGASTLHSFLARYERHIEGNRKGPGFAEAKAALQGRYLLLDEASMVSAEQMERLIRLANVMEVGRLAIIGDQRQLSSIDWGKPFAMIQAAMHRAGEVFPHVTVNRRQKTEAMRALADAADAGQLKAAFAALGERITEARDPVAAAARDYLALTPAAREQTVLLPSGRAGRAEANALIQEGLKAEGTLKGEGLVLTVRERADVSREGLRYAVNWREAAILEVSSRNNALGLPKGDYRIDFAHKNGKVELTDTFGRVIKVDPVKIPPDKSNTALRLVNEKQIRVHEGEKLRWTDNDKSREIYNQTTMTVRSIGKDGITMQLADGAARFFAHGDPMLKRLDLAYAINTHMAQGITVERAMAVMQSWERNLSNMRSFLVNFTRQQSEARLYTDSADKLKTQIGLTPGNKTSALEAIGALAVDQQLKLGGPSPTGPGASKGPERGPDGPSSPAASPARDGAAPPRDDKPHIPKPPVLDRSKGMEL